MRIGRPVEAKHLFLLVLEKLEYQAKQNGTWNEYKAKCAERLRKKIGKQDDEDKRDFKS